MVDVKHVGRITNTDKRCVVIWPQLPDSPEQSLVVDTDSLPYALHQALMDLVEGEGQSQHKLYDLLSRRFMPDTRVDVLSTLHQRNHLQAVSVDNLEMTPRPNVQIPMRNVINHMNEMRNNELQRTLDVPDNIDASSVPSEHMYTENRNITDQNENDVVAQGLLFEAQMLEDDARKKREDAYTMSPGLRPSMTVSSDNNPDGNGKSPPKRRGRPRKSEEKK